MLANSRSVRARPFVSPSLILLTDFIYYSIRVKNSIFICILAFALGPLYWLALACVVCLRPLPLNSADFGKGARLHSGFTYPTVLR